MATAAHMAPQPAPIHRFTREDYHALAEAGILAPEDNVELIDGI